MDLFDACVPVLRHYLAQLDGLIARGGEALTARLAPDGFTAREHAEIAQGYALRIAYPLAGLPVPDLPDAIDAKALQARGQVVVSLLDRLPSSAFDAADEVMHHAGDATLRQDPQTFLMLYGLPNFLFHIVTCHAILRAQGIAVGKGDYDGFHQYGPGFSFVDDPQP